MAAARDPAACFEEEAERVLARDPGLRIVPEGIAKAALASCEAAGLPHALLAEQVRASQVFVGSVRFPDGRAVNTFIEGWACPHARLLACLAGISGSWQYPYVDELARGFFWTGRLMTLKRDLAQDRLFVPEADLAQHGVPVEQLEEGRVDEPMKRLLWKQTIRAKQAFALAEPLVQEISRRQAHTLKRWWMGALEVLHEIRRREYDLWKAPITLSVRHRVQVRFQARFGRTSFRSR